MRAGVLTASALMLALPAWAEEGTGRWQVSCVGEAEARRCEAVQSIFDAAGEVVLRVAFGAVGEDGKRELVLRVPQGTLLRDDVTVAVETAPEPVATASYLSCFDRGCFAQTFVTGDEIIRLEGSDAVLVGFKDRSGRTIQVAVPFAGLSAALIQITP